MTLVEVYLSPSYTHITILRYISPYSTHFPAEKLSLHLLQPFIHPIPPQFTSYPLLTSHRCSIADGDDLEVRCQTTAASRPPTTAFNIVIPCPQSQSRVELFPSRARHKNRSKKRSKNESHSSLAATPSTPPDPQVCLHRRLQLPLHSCPTRGRRETQNVLEIMDHGDYTRRLVGNHSRLQPST